MGVWQVCRTMPQCKGFISLLKIITEFNTQFWHIFNFLLCWHAFWGTLSLSIIWFNINAFESDNLNKHQGYAFPELHLCRILFCLWLCRWWKDFQCKEFQTWLNVSTKYQLSSLISIHFKSCRLKLDMNYHDFNPIR